MCVYYFIYTYIRIYVYIMCVYNTHVHIYTKYVNLYKSCVCVSVCVCGFIFLSDWPMELSAAGSLLRYLKWLRMVQADVRSWELNPALPLGWMALKYLNHKPLPPKVCISKKLGSGRVGNWTQPSRMVCRILKLQLICKAKCPVIEPTFYMVSRAKRELIKWLSVDHLENPYPDIANQRLLNAYCKLEMVLVPF